MIELDDIQGFLLQPQVLPLGRYFFLQIREPAQGRHWLGQMIASVSTATPWREPPTSQTGLAFTYNGLAALGLAQASLATFDAEFREGMAARAAVLGDTGPSSPEHWAGGLATADLHAVLILMAQTPAEVEARSREYRALIEAAGVVAELSVQDCAAIPGPRDHFGYRDGISDLVVEDTPERPKPNKGPTVKPGEFFLGYPDESGTTPQVPQPEALGRNGSYLVYRRLYEDVGAFRSFLQAEAESSEEREWVAAKLVGRWRSGAPLVLAPRGDDPALAADATRNNDFNYAEMDPQGLACPLGAHIRRVNPRDAVPNVQRSRLIRRGLPYGPSLGESEPDDGADRGVTIFFGNASLARQFEFVQRIWINDSTFIGLGNEKDPLVGANDGTTNLTIPRKPFRRRITGLPRFTVVKGGAYFYLPSIKALRFLADIPEA